MFSANTSQVSNDVKYIEDFFSAWLRTGTGSSQTVTTGIKENTGALVISKSRSAATDWAWYDTFRGATKDLVSNSTAAETTQSQGLTSFNADGHTWGTLAKVNTSGATYVDYVLKPTPKFFDVVTFSHTLGVNETISHSLGSTPGCILVKMVNGVDSWFVYHISNGTGKYLNLNSTAAVTTNALLFQSVTSTTFQFNPNANTGTYVAYLFAHNAGGFGLTGTDNVISCGSYAVDAAQNKVTVNLGYEPQLLMIKRADSTSNWFMFDNMRGITTGGDDAQLYANTSGAEVTNADAINLTATGFETGANATVLQPSATYIYIAIRRGPMKTPTSGTSVFQANTYTTNGTDNRLITTNTVVDLNILTSTTLQSSRTVADRLRGGDAGGLITNGTGAETTGYGLGLDTNIGYKVGTANYNPGGSPFGVVGWSFSRAPGFFDVVCYPGTFSAKTVNHNLGVVPELIIFKKRNGVERWSVYSASLNANQSLTLSADWAAGNDDVSNNTRPTSTVFSVSGSNEPLVNEAGYNYVAYLFASCPGVSKVGSYTGTGGTQTISCGFTGGARFVLIKRTDSTGNWWLWDSTRGMVSGTDPRMPMNVDTVQSNTDWVYTTAVGFQIVTADASVNASGGSYIYLAIA